MEDMIYLIVEGIYSDWKVLGWCPTEEEAILCAAKLNTDPRAYDPVYIVGVKRATPDSAVSVMYRYPVHIWFGGTEWHITVSYDRVKYTNGATCPVGGVSAYPHYPDVQYGYIFTHTNDQETIDKVAQDYLYQWLARKNGLL